MVTRIEIADAVEDAFQQTPATRADLLEAAEAANASADVLAVLQRLPEQQYRTMRELWPHLGGVPVAR